MVKPETGMRSGKLALFPRLVLVAGVAVLVSGCASVAIPFGDVFDRDGEPVHTASADTQVEAPSQTQMPPELNAVAPIEAESIAAEPSARPAEDLVASIPQSQPRRVSLSQSDLNAMGQALTHVLETDPDVGTFEWQHEATGRSGLMTPFRRTSSSDQGACRVVSVEITDNDNDTLLLADACQQNGRWVFVTPRAGQAL